MLRHRTRGSSSFLFLAAACVPLIVACTDVGDNTGTAGDGGGSGTDATTTPDVVGGEDPPGASTPDATTGGEASTVDTGVGGQAEDATTAAESGAPDSGGGVDAAVDTGAGTDARAEETGAPETGAPDAHGAEAGSDATVADSSTADSSTADTGADSGGGDLQAQCDAFLVANMSTLLPVTSTCSPTEKALFTKDPTGGCLNCAFEGGCLDDSNGDSGQECEDSFSTFGTEAECLATLACDFGLNPAKSPAPADGLAINAYCGPGNSTSNCETGSGPAGACVTEIVAGFPSSFTPTNIVNSISVRGYAAGMADAITSCINSRYMSTQLADCAKCLN
jgi:hypothetical protein